MDSRACPESGRNISTAALNAPGPLVIDLVGCTPTLGRRRPLSFRSEITDPVRNEWGVAHATWEDFADVLGPGEEFSSPGWSVEGLVVRAPLGGGEDVLDLDAVWIWTSAPAPAR